MNTGDPGGDVDFVLSRKEIAVECEQNPGGERCFLAHANIYLRVEVEVDGRSPFTLELASARHIS